MRIKKLTTTIIASIIVAIVLGVCLNKIVYKSNHHEISITIQYENDVYEEHKMEAGDTLHLLKQPVREGYEFLGWYADENFTIEYNFNQPITKNTTIYAKMKKI